MQNFFSYNALSGCRKFVRDFAAVLVLEFAINLNLVENKVKLVQYGYKGYKIKTSHR